MESLSNPPHLPVIVPNLQSPILETVEPHRTDNPAMRAVISEVSLQREEK